MNELVQNILPKAFSQVKVSWVSKKTVTWLSFVPLRYSSSLVPALLVTYQPDSCGQNLLLFGLSFVVTLLGSSWERPWVVPFRESSGSSPHSFRTLIDTVCCGFLCIYLLWYSHLFLTTNDFKGQGSAFGKQLKHKIYHKMPRVLL